MEVKRLEAEEYDCLKQFHDGFCPDPRESRATVIKDGDEPVGRIFLVAPLHIEGPWVRENKRGGTILKRLVDEAEQQARELGATRLFAFGANEELEGYLLRLGYEKQPLTVWKKEI